MKSAAAYLRRSTDDKQVESLEIQQGIIDDYSSTNGYDIVATYQDDGISGHDERQDYNRMMTDAAAGLFDYIVVRDQSRFTRIDAADTITELNRLRHMDVSLVDCEEGVVDIDDFIGFLKTSMKAQQNHNFSLKLSELTINGQAKHAAKGYSCGQPAPYAMDRMFVDNNGKHVLRLAKGQRAPKGQGGVIFVPCEDQEKIDTVRFIFDRYVNFGDGFFVIAEKLNLDGVEAPKGGTWNKGTVRDILKNEIYCGDFIWNQRREGKFHARQGGKARSRPRKERDQTLMNSPEDWVVVEDCHEGIIDRSLYKRAQTLMKERDKRAGTKAADNFQYVLTGLLTCAECGFNLTGKRTSKTKTVNGVKKKYVNRNYKCPTRQRRGKHLCSGGGCDAAELHESIQRALVSKFRNVELIDRLVDKMNEIVAQPKQKDETERLTAQLTKVTKEVKTLASRLAKVPDDMVDDVLAESSNLTERRKSIESQIEAAKKKSEPRRQKFTRQEVVSLLVRSSRQIEKMDTDSFARWLHANVAEIEVEFQQVPHGKGTRGVLLQAKIRLKKSSQLIMAGTRCSAIRGFDGRSIYGEKLPWAVTA